MTMTSVSLMQEAGNFLKSLREEKGLYQREVGHRLGLAYPSIVTRWESGSKKLPINKFYSMSRILSIDSHRFAVFMMRCYYPELYACLNIERLNNNENEK